MKTSFSHRIVLAVLRLKGLKKIFSQSPIDYAKLRKDDVHKGKGRFFRNARRLRIGNTQVTEIPASGGSNNLVLYVPGGAFVSGPAAHHWDAVRAISRATGQTIWLCDYPKAPEANIEEISAEMDAVWAAASEKFNPSDISLVGDSVGGTLVLALTQRMVARELPLPRQLLLISPVADARMSHPEIDTVDLLDPMLSRAGVLSAKKMCAVNGNLEDPRISPGLGKLKGLPPVTLFMAEHDITFPDQEKLQRNLINEGVETNAVIGKEMPHIWPLLPVMKEAKAALQELIHLLEKG